MVEQLRRKFIFSAMLSILLILVCIISALYGLNRYQMERRTDLLLDYVIENKDGFPVFDQPPFKPDQNERSDDEIEAFSEVQSGKQDFNQDSSGEPDRLFWGWNDNDIRIDAETPFRTRFFTVHYDNEGNCVGLFLDQIASVSESAALSYGNDALADLDGKGKIGVYKYKRTISTGGIDCTFLDISEDLDNLRRSIVSSLLVSFISYLLIFLLIWIISGRVIRPFAKNIELQKRFITDAGHELKTPLAIISANTEVVEMTSGESEWTSNIHSQISRMTELIQRLLVLARMEEDNIQLHFSDFSLSDAVFQSADPFVTLAQTQGKSMMLDLPEGLNYRGDERSIRELISILCDNAVKYCDENGQIKLNVQKLGKKYRITVSNTCTSGDKSDFSQWFGRFYRDETSRSRDTGGFGIGLSIAKAITEVHKGKINAFYEDGVVVIVSEI